MLHQKGISLRNLLSIQRKYQNIYYTAQEENLK